jgi:hypothetical protein
MTIVNTSWSYGAAVPWQTSTPVATDPSERIQTQLATWVAAISGNSSGEKISILKKPSDCTTKGGATDVGWLLKTPENISVPNPSGLTFLIRPGNATNTTTNGKGFYNWTSTTGNNNLGAYSLDGTFLRAMDMTAANTIYTVYEADVTLPWFAAFQHISTALGYFHVISRLDTSIGSIASGSSVNSAAPWLSFYGYSTNGYMSQPVNGVGDPRQGISATNKSQSITNLVPIADTAAYFTYPRCIMGDTSLVGTINNTCLVGSGSTTGVVGDTVVLSTGTYQKISSYIWIRIS